MDGDSNHPPAQDSPNIGGQSLALKGGAAGSLLFLLAFIIYVFLKKCDSCTIIFKLRADDASSRPVEEAWNEEVGCNYNKLAYTYISKDFKDEVKWSNASVPLFSDMNKFYSISMETCTARTRQFASYNIFKLAFCMVELNWFL